MNALLTAIGSSLLSVALVWALWQAGAFPC